MSRYAEHTEVSEARSREEIERTLRRYGAEGFAYGWEKDRAALVFQMHNRRIRLEIAMPERESPEFQRTPVKRLPRSKQDAFAAWDQACRQRWRALALVVLAKLEAVAAGIASFENEFLAYTLLTDGRTVGEWAKPQVDRVYETGQMPPLLPGMPPERSALGPGGDE